MDTLIIAIFGPEYDINKTGGGWIQEQNHIILGQSICSNDKLSIAAKLLENKDERISKLTGRKTCGWNNREEDDV